MNKNYLFLAAAATILASCAESEKLNNGFNAQENPAVIGFSTYSENATKAIDNENDLEFYHGTFAVYATKKSTTDTSAPTEVVFRGEDDPVDANLKADIITYDETKMAPNNWTYAPYRYWDKQATYNFVAVAPNTSIIKYNMPTNVADGEGTYVTTAAYKLEGQNLQSSTAPAESEIKKGFVGGTGKDTDLMTAGKQTKSGSAPSEVNFIFKHILAKLNISIAKDPTLDNTKVLIKSVEVTGLADQGTYVETSSTTASGWSASASANAANYKLSWANANGIELLKGTGSGENYEPGKALYFIESLIMPQTIETNIEELKINYTIVSGTNAENYVYVLKLDDGTIKVFENFMEGNNYTIKLTVKPNIITFDASTAVWADKTATANTYQ